MIKVPRNTLYYGDNLAILRERPSDSVDLIYLDPPFNSNATYNVLFKAPDGHQSQAQIEAFDDTWHWTSAAEQAFDEVVQSGNSDAATMLIAMRQFLRENDLMAYLAMMAVRLIELRRVLKPTGSLYLHCDPTASHYLKILLDAVFGKEHFRNEITWKRTGAHSDSKTWSRVADKLYFYTKGEKFTWNVPFEAHADDYLDSHYGAVDEHGRRFQLTSILSPSPRPNMMYEWKGFPSPPMGWRFSKKTMAEHDDNGLIWYPKKADGSFDTGKRPRFIRFLDEQKGNVVTTIWTDIAPVNARAQERLGYPTQKPVALLERILAASSNEGDVILDPFCGCGTTLHAAAKLKRRWIGIDITHLAIGLIRRRLKEAFPRMTFDTVGVPKDLGGAQALALQDKYEFQKWALSMIEAQPYKGGKKGGDGGIDGYLYFKPDGKKTEKAIVSVKGGQSLNPAMVKDPIVTVEQEGAKMGVFLMLETPTKGMIAQAAAAGFYKTEYGQFPKIQIVTIAQLFELSNPLQMPWQDTSMFKKSKREDTETQSSLDV